MKTSLKRPAAIATSFLVLAVAAGGAQAQAPSGDLTDAQIRQRIVRESVASFPGPGACPYTRLRDGRTVGPRSAYSRPGGLRAKCYSHDVSREDVAAYRRSLQNQGTRNR